MQRSDYLTLACGFKTRWQVERCGSALGSQRWRGGPTERKHFTYLTLPALCLSLYLLAHLFLLLHFLWGGISNSSIKITSLWRGPAGHLSEGRREGAWRAYAAKSSAEGAKRKNQKKEKEKQRKRWRQS
jgi:hypothetical protein